MNTKRNQTRGASKSGFVGDVVKLVSGTTAAQVISIIVVPILTRLYAPEAFGVLAIFISIVSVLGECSCFGYDRAIMLPKSDDDAAKLVAISSFLSLFISILCVPVLLLFGQQISSMVGTAGMTGYLSLIPLTVLMTGIFLALNQWNSRRQKYTRLSVARVMNTTISSAEQIGCGIVGMATSFNMIVGSTLGTIGSTLFLGFAYVRDAGAYCRLRSIRSSEMKALMARYRKFPLYDTWSTILNNISWQLPVFFLAGYFSPVEAGYYALGNRVLRMPMNFIGTSMAQVFYQRASQAKQDGSLSQLVEGVFKRLVAFGLFPMLIIMFVGRELFSIVCGTQWAEAGVYTQILSVWTFFWFISSPLSSLFYIHEKQDMLLLINALILVTRIASLWIGGVLGNARLAVGLFAVSGVVMYGYLSLYMLRTSHMSLGRIFRIIGVQLMTFIPVALVLASLRWWQVAPWVTLIVASAFLIMYMSVTAMRDTHLRGVMNGWLAGMKGRLHAPECV